MPSRFHAFLYLLFVELWIVVLGIPAACVGLGQLPSSAPPSPPTERNPGREISMPSSNAPMHFHDIAAQAGLTVVPRSSSERRYLVETMGGGGIALFDCDNDGKLDAVVFNAAGPPSLFLNQRRNANHRVLFRLIGTNACPAPSRQLNHRRANGMGKTYVGLIPQVFHRLEPAFEKALAEEGLSRTNLGV